VAVDWRGWRGERETGEGVRCESESSRGLVKEKEGRSARE
jgi:hypothetical protein